MESSRSLRRLCAGLVTAALLMSQVFVGTAHADAAARYKQQAEQFEAMLAKQAESDQSDAAAEDRQMTAKWLDNAQVLLAKGSEEAAGRLLKRVELALQMMSAMITAANIRAVADQQEEAFYKAKQEQIPELKAEIDKLKQEKQKLATELQQLRR